MPEGIALLTIFVLSAFTGYEVISKVSTILHTPLMSAANAISGLILVGAILVAGRAETTVELVVGLLAVSLAALNLVGGFVVTDRMLDMFRTRRQEPAGAPSAGRIGRGRGKSRPGTAQPGAAQPGAAQPGAAQPQAGTRQTGSDRPDANPAGRDAAGPAGQGRAGNGAA